MESGPSRGHHAPAASTHSTPPTHSAVAAVNGDAAQAGGAQGVPPRGTHLTPPTHTAVGDVNTDEAATQVVRAQETPPSATHLTPATHSNPHMQSLHSSDSSSTAAGSQVLDDAAPEMGDLGSPSLCAPNPMGSIQDTAHQPMHGDHDAADSRGVKNGIRHPGGDPPVWAAGQVRWGRLSQTALAQADGCPLNPLATHSPLADYSPLQSAAGHGISDTITHGITQSQVQRSGKPDEISMQAARGPIPHQGDRGNPSVTMQASSNRGGDPISTPASAIPTHSVMTPPMSGSPHVHRYPSGLDDSPGASPNPADSASSMGDSIRMSPNASDGPSHSSSFPSSFAVDQAAEAHTSSRRQGGEFSAPGRNASRMVQSTAATTSRMGAQSTGGAASGMPTDQAKRGAAFRRGSMDLPRQASGGAASAMVNLRTPSFTRLPIDRLHSDLTPPTGGVMPQTSGPSGSEKKKGVAAFLTKTLSGGGKTSKQPAAANQAPSLQRPSQGMRSGAESTTGPQDAAAAPGPSKAKKGVWRGLTSGRGTRK